ncbi:MAG: heat-inducible transcription repressor HrcA [Clostridia bacterium]|nr:heat-inducible transcription repressor HrcA [Clostridia bacterium]
MELSERKRAIIAEIVRFHIESGEPIGSKILAERLPNAPSTATLRNEMNELCQMGYLSQPHTSAGRIPTSKAYRLYVTELMQHETLSEEGKLVLDKMLETLTPDPENIGASAATILSELTGLPVLALSNVGQNVKIKKVSLLPMGRSSAVIFLITDDGRARSRLVCIDSPLSDNIVNKFNEIVGERICGQDATTLDAAYLQSTVVLAGLDALSIAPLLSGVFSLAGELRESDVKMVGTENLFSLFRTEAHARRMLELLQGNDTVTSIIGAVTDPVGVVFGDDTAFSELEPAGMIVASFGDERQYGKIALIGPTRMSYGKLLPSVEYLAGRVGNIMSNVLKGLEE